jgi:hypothetical protein
MALLQLSETQIKTHFDKLTEELKASDANVLSPTWDLTNILILHKMYPLTRTSTGFEHKSDKNEIIITPTSFQQRAVDAKRVINGVVEQLPVTVDGVSAKSLDSFLTSTKELFSKPLFRITTQPATRPTNKPSEAETGGELAAISTTLHTLPKLTGNEPTPTAAMSPTDKLTEIELDLKGSFNTTPKTNFYNKYIKYYAKLLELR